MRIIYVLFLLIIGTNLFSQTPQKISYQAVARDASGYIVTSSIGVKFQIYQGSVSGTLVYEETHTATPSSSGIFTVYIGGGSVVSGNFSTINWGANSYFLQVSIDPNGGTSYSTVGANQLVSVPYALYANEAGSAPSPTLAFGSGVLTVGNNTVNIPTSGSYNAGTGIAINSGSIINTAADQTVNISSIGIATVTNAYPNFSVNVGAPSITYNSSTKELTLNQGGTTSTATLTGTGTNTISIVGTGVANVTPTGAASNFTVNVPSPVIIGQGATSVLGVWPNFTISSSPATTYVAGSGISITSNTITNTAPNQTVTLSGLGSTTISGTYPNYTIATPVPTIAPVPVLVGTGITSVTSVANNYTINTPPVGMSYISTTGILSYSPAPSINTINISPAVSFTNNILSVGSNTVNVPGTGLWTKSGSNTNLFNTTDLVGIGTAAPVSKLHVSDPTSKVTIESTTASALSSLDFKTNGGGIASINKYGSSGRLAIVSGGAYNMQFLNSIGGSFQFDEGVNTRMMIATGGSVGIGTGTTPPNGKLEIADGSMNGSSLLVTSNNGSAIDAGAAIFNSTGLRSINNSAVIINNLVTKSGGSGSTKIGLEVNSTGSWAPTTGQPNVGIKVTASGADNNYALQLIDGSQGAGKVLTSDATGGASWQPVSIINHGSISCQNVANVTNIATKFSSNLLSFNKTYADTKVEVIVQTDINVFDLVGSNCVRYELRINGIAAAGTTGRANYFWDNNGSTAVTNDRGVTMIGEFLSLAAGSYNVELWVSCPFGGSAVNAYIDPGCFSASSIIVKEYK